MSRAFVGVQLGPEPIFEGCPERLRGGRLEILDDTPCYVGGGVEVDPKSIAPDMRIELSCETSLKNRVVREV